MRNLTLGSLFAVFNTVKFKYSYLFLISVPVVLTIFLPARKGLQKVLKRRNGA